MAYKLSERLNQDFPQEDAVSEDFDLNKVRNVFIIFGILGLLTAWVFSFDSETIFKNQVRPSIITDDSAQSIQQDDAKNVATIGPISVAKFKEVYSITISSKLPVNSWAFIEGEVLDAEKDYLFSFGQELWHETGYDDEGKWEEAETGHKIKITFPDPGKYYLNFKTQGSSTPNIINVQVTKSYGSSIPHMLFGIICLVIGILLNEQRNRTISIALERMNKRYD